MGTVSGSELLQGLVGKDLSRWLAAYHMMNEINDLQARMLDLSVGAASSLTSSENNRGVIRNEINDILKVLEPLLKALSNSPSDQSTEKRQAEAAPAVASTAHATRTEGPP